MNAQAIRRLRTEKLALSRTTFARLLRVSENTIFRWENGKVRPDPHAHQTLEQLNRLCDVLLPSMEAPAVATWLERANPAIDNFRPIDLLGFEYGRLKLRSLIEETGLVVRAL
jgi:transcriptional regulator with XRE-family HTH domain